jgi:hypothetical protein
LKARDLRDRPIVTFRRFRVGNAADACGSAGKAADGLTGAKLDSPITVGHARHVPIIRAEFQECR